MSVLLTHRTPERIHTSWSATPAGQPLAQPDSIAADTATASDGFMALADRHIARLDPTTRLAVQQFGSDHDAPGTLVLSGVPIGEVPATPPSPLDTTDKDRISELSLMAFARLLGEPVGYLPEHGGDIVQNISPTVGDAARQTSTSSGVQLAFHTETAFHEHKPRFLLLLCLRGDDAAHTTLCCIDDIIGSLTDESRSVLFENRFHTRADESFGGGVGARFGSPMAVLSGDERHPTMTFDEELTSGIDDLAQSALHELSAAIRSQHTSVTLRTGDMAIIDNHRCVHGRSPFAARFDGTDRWLQRTFVVEDLVRSAGERTGRIITTTFVD